MIKQVAPKVHCPATWVEMPGPIDSMLATILCDPGLVQKVAELAPLVPDSEHFFDPKMGALFEMLTRFGSREADLRGDDLLKALQRDPALHRQHRQALIGQIAPAQPFCTGHALNSLLWFFTEREFYRRMAQGFAVLEEQTLTGAQLVRFLVKAVDFPNFSESRLLRIVVRAVVEPLLARQQTADGSVDKLVLGSVIRDWLNACTTGALEVCYHDKSSIAGYSFPDWKAAVDRLSRAGLLDVLTGKAIPVGFPGRSSSGGGWLQRALLFLMVGKP